MQQYAPSSRNHKIIWTILQNNILLRGSSFSQKSRDLQFDKSTYQCRIFLSDACCCLFLFQRRLEKHLQENIYHWDCHLWCIFNFVFHFINNFTVLFPYPLHQSLLHKILHNWWCRKCTNLSMSLSVFLASWMFHFYTSYGQNHW